MPVLFDAQVSVQGVSVTSITTGAFTVGSGENRAAILQLEVNSNAISNIAMSFSGGHVCQPIPGSDTLATNGNRSLCFGTQNPPTGSRTVTASWTTAAFPALGVITAFDVHQQTPFGDGRNTQNVDTLSLSLTFANIPGEMSSTIEFDALGTPATTNQTSTWSQANNGGGDRSVTPGATHTWTRGSSGSTTLSGAVLRERPTYYRAGGVLRLRA